MFNINTITLYMYSFTHERLFHCLFIGFVWPVRYEIKQIQSIFCHSFSLFTNETTPTSQTLYKIYSPPTNCSPSHPNWPPPLYVMPAVCPLVGLSFFMHVWPTSWHLPSTPSWLLLCLCEAPPLPPLSTSSGTHSFAPPLSAHPSGQEHLPCFLTSTGIHGKLFPLRACNTTQNLYMSDMFDIFP